MRAISTARLSALPHVHLRPIDVIVFGGRLGEYKYYDMDKVIESAMGRAEEIFG